MNNFVYYEIIKDVDNNEYAILFVPSGDINVTENYFSPNLSNAFYRRFPKGFILKDSIEIDANFDNDIPIGMSLASELKFKVNLSVLSGLSELSGLITTKVNSLALRTVYGRNIYIPNGWLILKNTGSAFNRLEYFGFQELRPENTFTLGDVNLYEISCLSFEQSVLKRINTQDLSSQALTVTPTEVSYVKNLDIEDTVTNPYTAEQQFIKTQYGYGSKYDAIFDGQTFEMITLAAFINHIYNVADDMFEALARRPIEWENTFNVPYTSCGYYKRNDEKDILQFADTNSLSLLAGAYIIYGIKLDGTRVATIFEGASQSIDLDNAYDILRYMTEESIMKTSLLFSPNGTGLGVISNLILNNKYLLGNQYYIADKTLVKDDFINGVTITDSYNVIGSIQISNKLINTTDNQTEYIYKNMLSIKDNSFDIKTIFHSRAIIGEIRYNKAGNWEQYGTGEQNVRMIDKEPDLRGLYYLNNSNEFIKIYDDIQINLSDSLSFSIFDTSVLANPIESHSYYFGSKRNVIANRLDLMSWNKRQTEAINYLLGEGSQVLLETSMKSDRVKPTYLGEKYSINMGLLTGEYPFAGSDAILVNTVWQLEKNICNVKFFVI